jgi:hypothetical protein
MRTQLWGWIFLAIAAAISIFGYHPSVQDFETFMLCAVAIILWSFDKR